MRIESGKPYKLKPGHRANYHSGRLAAGTVCYKAAKYDYGLASDDSRWTGIEHISMTLNADGDYPTFTVPVDDLVLADAPIEEEGKS